jgi:hypothetical protein
VRILDATAGSRAVWFDKNYPDAVYLDLTDRRFPGNELGDCRHTRFSDGELDLVIFDPPHVNVGPNSHMAKSYGHFTTQEIRDLVREAFAEFHRILRPDGMVAFKWADHDTPLDRILATVRGFDRLVGVPTAMRTKHSSQTWWCLMRKVPIRDRLSEFDAARSPGGGA